jgi:uncharacterized protein YcbX
VQLMRSGRGFFDAFPVSVLSVGTVRSLAHAVGRDLDPRRFRPNVLVEACGGEAHAEDDWIGRTLRIGAETTGAAIHVDARDERCVIPNVDPDSAERDARVLREIAQHHDTCSGVYAAVARPGPVAVGDRVWLE